MVLGAGAAAAMAGVGFSAPRVLVVTAAANLLVALWIVRILPHEVYRSLFRWFFHAFHGVTVRGLENYRAAGSRVVIVSNHQSYFDACLIAAFLPDNPDLRHRHGADQKMVGETVPQRGRYVPGRCADRRMR